MPAVTYRKALALGLMVQATEGLLGGVLQQARCSALGVAALLAVLSSPSLVLCSRCALFGTT